MEDTHISDLEEHVSAIQPERTLVLAIIRRAMHRGKRSSSKQMKFSGVPATSRIPW